MDRQPLAMGFAKREEKTPPGVRTGFAVLILTKRHIIKGGICADISRFRLSLLGNAFSVVNQILANLQEL